jgi:4-hydroxybenzoate polyprenyltransferase
MMYALAITVILLLAAALLALGWRAYQNHQEIERLRRNGCRRLAFRRYHRGGAEPELLQALAELTLLVLLLVAVLGWMGAAAPRW